MENNQARRLVRNILQEKFFKEERLSFDMFIPEDIKNIKEILKGAGYKTFIVGGAVRDALLGKTPKDYDIATDALPDTVEQLMSSHYKTLPTGKAFGVINVFTSAGDYEIATFRKDIGAGRRPDSVEFTTIDNDVKRRDLTINALFYDIDSKEVVDLVGGINDLKQGIVRTVGSAEERFNEDRLRILRAIRFAARFGSNLDGDTHAALIANNSLEGVSSERIRDEFLKGIKSAKSVVLFLSLLQKYNLFDWIFGSLILKEKGMQSIDLIEERDVAILFAYMLGDNKIDNVKAELHNLKYSIDEITQISFLLNFKNLSADNAFKLKKSQTNSKLSIEQIKNFSEWIKMDEKLTNAFISFKLTVTGKELMDQGFTGKQVGSEMEQREIENFKNLI